MVRRLFAALASIVIAASLSTTAAFASQDDIDMAAASPMKSQVASTCTAYVATNIGGVRCGYNSNGLLVSQSYECEGITQTAAYSYAGKALKSAKKLTKSDSLVSSVESKVVADKSGRIERMTMLEKYASGTRAHKHSLTYDKKGRVVKSSAVQQGGSSYKENWTATYDENERLVGILSDLTGWNCDSYTWDELGYMSGCRTSNMESWHLGTFENSYKGNRLVKRIVRWSSLGKSTCNYSYKKVKVPKAYKQLIELQQFQLLNWGVGFVLPDTVQPGQGLYGSAYPLF